MNAAAQNRWGTDEHARRTCQHSVAVHAHSRFTDPRCSRSTSSISSMAPSMAPRSFSVYKRASGLAAWRSRTLIAWARGKERGAASAVVPELLNNQGAVVPRAPLTHTREREEKRASGASRQEREAQRHARRARAECESLCGRERRARESKSESERGPGKEQREAGKNKPGNLRLTENLTTGTSQTRRTTFEQREPPPGRGRRPHAKRRGTRDTRDTVSRMTARRRRIKRKKGIYIFPSNWQLDVSVPQVAQAQTHEAPQLEGEREP